jgi:tyrosine-protein kinase Etk/Wzc
LRASLDLALRLGGMLRRNWLIFVVFVGGAVGSVYYRSRNLLPNYTARAVIQLRDKSRALAAGLAAANPVPSSDESQIQVLQSRAVAHEVAARSGLRLRLPLDVPLSIVDDVTVANSVANTPVTVIFAASRYVAVGGGARGEARYGEPLTIGGVTFTVRSRPKVSEATFQITSLDNATAEVMGSLHGQTRLRTTIVDVYYTAHDPIVAQRVVNTAVQVFQERDLQNALQESVRRRQFIQQQLDKTETTLSEAQLQYNQFLTRSQVSNPQEQLRAAQASLSDLSSRRQQLVSDQRAYSATLDSLEDPARSSNFRERLSVLMAAPSLSSNPLISNLYAQLARYDAARDTVFIGPMAMALNSPEVRKLDTLIAATKKSLIKTMRIQVAAIGARIVALDDLQGQMSKTLATLPTVGAQEAALRAQVDRYRREADRMHDALEAAAIDAAAQVGQVDIVDFATPGGRISAGTTPRYVLAALFGLVLAAAAAYARENRSDVIRIREDLEDLADTPSLATVPQMRALPRQRGPALLGVLSWARGGTKAAVPASPTAAIEWLATVADPHSTGSEAYRTLRTNILFSAAVQSIKRITITSATPKEGKSTTSANLGAVCAQQGQRVLLIDCDLRAPRVHTIFGRPRSPGLTNVLAGAATLEESLIRTEVDGLTLLTAGTSPPNPAELLGSSKMQELLDRLSEQFDLVIIDTPPLLPTSDAALVGRLSDGTIMVVRAGQTSRAAVQQAFQQLSNVGARILGTVLNDPDAEVARYSPYYHKYYDAYYYHTTAEE